HYTFCLSSGPTLFFFFNHPAPTEIYTLSLHDALPILMILNVFGIAESAKFSYFLVLFNVAGMATILGTGYLFSFRPGLNTIQFRSEEHTSELQSRFDLVCRLLLEKKKQKTKANNTNHN